MEARGADTPPDDRRRQLARIGEKVGDLPALPHIAMRALKLAEREDWSITELENEILLDHALAARLLHLANSPYFGARRRITTVNRALSLIGNRKARSVLMAAAVEGLHEDTRSIFRDEFLWEHALATAAVSQHFATTFQTCNPDDAFMAGLLHDIGRLVMDSRFPDRYRRVVDLVETGDTETFLDAEQEVFGFTHTDVGFLVATGWHLPPVIAEVMLFHHEPALASSDRNLCATVSLANSACAKHGVSVESQPELDLGSLASTQILGMDESQLEESMQLLFTDTKRPSTGAG